MMVSFTGLNGAVIGSFSSILILFLLLISEYAVATYEKLAKQLMLKRETPLLHTLERRVFNAYSEKPVC